jgi:integrase
MARSWPAPVKIFYIQAGNMGAHAEPGSRRNPAQCLAFCGLRNNIDEHTEHGRTCVGVAQPVAQGASPMRKKLTELSVAKMKPPASGRVEIWDTLLPTFGLRVSSTGRRTWMVAIRRPGKKQPSRISIGTLPPMSLVEARTAARAMMTAGAPGSPLKFKGLAEEFLEHGRTRKGRPWRAATLQAYQRVLRTAAEPLHHRRVQDIRRRDIADLLRAVSTERGATMAALTRATLGRFWSWMAEVDDELDYNPVTNAPLYEVGKRNRVLSDAELAAIWAATEERSDYNMIIRLLLWTGARRGEVGGMRWGELSKRQLTLWSLPAERTKNHRELVLPLPRQARTALESWPRIDGRDHLFGRAGYQGWSDAKTRLDARLRLNQDWDLHDLRRTVETRMAGLGIRKEIANRVLNHAVGPVTAAYDHYDYLAEKADALQRWADAISGTVR